MKDVFITFLHLRPGFHYGLLPSDFLVKTFYALSSLAYVLHTHSFLSAMVHPKTYSSMRLNVQLQKKEHINS
jgi:hypothetical protein